MSDLQWITPEQEFLHQRVLLEIQKLSKDELVPVFEAMHKQLLVKSNLFNKMIRWCASTPEGLPDIQELLKPTEFPRRSWDIDENLTSERTL